MSWDGTCVYVVKNVTVRCLTGAGLNVGACRGLSRLRARAGIPSYVGSIMVRSIVARYICFIVAVGVSTSGKYIAVRFDLAACSTDRVETYHSSGINIVYGVGAGLCIGERFGVRLIGFRVDVDVCCVSIGSA